MIITSILLHSLIPNNKNPEIWVSPLQTYLPKYSICSKARIAMFMAQIIVESGELTHISEDLSYSSSQLIKLWPKHFNSKNVSSYVNNDEKIANLVYGNEYGNIAEGDGYKYRGRGAIQITFKGNYQMFSKAVDYDAVTNPDYLSTTTGAIQSACWFWSMHKMNILADKGDFTGITKIINAGLSDLDDRKRYYNKIIKEL
jgi:putative chitinase